MSAGYTCTTITTQPGKPARIGVAFHLDHTAWIRAISLDTDRPHLTISHGEVTAHLAAPLGPITTDSARIARDLADQAALYADALERLAAERTTTPAADSTAA